jgi:hypothetical protein
MRIYLCCVCILCYSHAVLVSAYVHTWHLYVHFGRLHHNQVLKILLRLAFVSISRLLFPKTNKLHGLSPQARTIPIERPPLVGEVGANFSG